MASANVTEECTDLLLNIREDAVEVELNSAVPNNNNNSSKKVSGKCGKFKSRAILCTQQLVRWLPSRHRCFLHVTSILHILLTVTLLVTVPVYVQISSQIGSDNFSSLFFVVAWTAIVLALLLGLRKFWDSNFVAYSKLAVRSTFRDSLIFTVSILGLSFCCEDYRVPCHLQDGLFFLCIPFSIVFMSIKKKKDKVNKNTKLIGILTAFMALVFISTVPLLAYRFSCRGNEMNSSGDYSYSRSLWVLFYIMFIAFLTCSLCGFWSSIQDHEDSCSHSFEWTSWFHLFCFGSLVCLFWTDVLPSVGVANGIDDFLEKFSSIWNCYFSNNCPTTSKLGFLIPVWWLFFLYMSNLLVYRFQSNPVYVVCNACLAIPLLSIFYSLFHIDSSGIQFKPSLSLGSLITMVMFPIAYSVLSCYHSTSIVYNLLDSFDIY